MDRLPPFHRSDRVECPYFFAESVDGQTSAAMTPAPGHDSSKTLARSCSRAAHRERAAPTRRKRVVVAEDAVKPRIVVVMPAYNAEATVERTVADIPKGSFNQIILVDDRSTDRTVAIARRIGLTVIEHEKNRGYGGNQKTCYDAALKAGADIVIMIHPDYQYDARLVPYLTGLLRDDICDVVLGNRIRTRQEALQGGMPAYKYISNRFLTMVENVCMGQNLGEWHSGLRAYNRKVLETIPWERNSEGFVFDCEFLVQAAAFGFRLGDIPTPARYFEEASSITFSRSVRYGLESLRTILRYYLHRARLWRCPLFEAR